MRIISSLLTIAGLASGAWWMWNNQTEFRETVLSYVENGEFLTLEARFSPEQLMKTHARDLLPDNRYAFQQPQLRFYPYLLLEVKFPQLNKKTKEGVILWSMVDGEMVIDTQTWEKTHGLEDCITAGACATDFKILNYLVKTPQATKEKIKKELNLTSEDLENWLNKAREKHLIIQNGKEIQIHLEKPKLPINPETKITQWLVTKTYNHAQRVNPKYSQRQIEKTARADFGEDFTIRSAKVVYLPVYNLEVLNPDGSILTSYWNALTGQRIDSRFMAY